MLRWLFCAAVTFPRSWASMTCGASTAISSLAHGYAAWKPGGMLPLTNRSPSNWVALSRYQVPLIIRAAGQSSAIVTNQLAESVDLCECSMHCAIACQQIVCVRGHRCSSAIWRAGIHRGRHGTDCCCCCCCC
jgi:hypothetical protein